MRKMLFCLAIGLILLCPFAQAQEVENSNFLDYGVKFGGNFNQFSQPGITLGGNIGAFGRLNVIDFLSVQGELLYDLQGGGRHDYETLNDEAVYTNRVMQLHTLSLPISAKLKPFSGESSSPYFLLGGSAEWVFGANEYRDIEFTDGGFLSRQNAGISDDLEDIQASFHIGAGFDFVQSNGRTLGLEVRWRQSLTNLNAARDDFGNSARLLYSTLYSSTFSINFYATLNELF